MKLKLISSSIILLLSNSALAFNDNYSSTSTVYSSTQSGDQASGSSGTNYRYPFAECLSLGMPSTSLSDYCTSVSFPTYSKEFYSVFPTVDGVTRTPEDFNKILESGAYSELEDKYITTYLGQLSPDWSIPTPGQLQTLITASKNGDLYKKSKEDYRQGRFLTKGSNGYIISNVGNAPKDSPIKLPNIVSKRGLGSSTLTDVSIPYGYSNKEFSTKYQFLTTQDFSGRFEADLSMDSKALALAGIDPSRVFFELLYGVPGTDGVIKNPVRTGTPYLVDKRLPDVTYFIQAAPIQQPGDSKDNQIQIKFYSDPAKVFYLKALKTQFDCRAQTCSEIN